MNPTIKKVLKFSLFSIVALLGLAIITMVSCSEKLPSTVLEDNADALTKKMLQAVNKDAWDELNYVQWSFIGKHHYVWDKKNNFVEVKWGDVQVLLDTKKVDGVVFKNGKKVDDKKSKYIKKAWSFFCNDSWWLNAPVKAMDLGVSRSVVELKDGRKGLKVSYESGGVTPGDSYVWILDEENKPSSYKMWVSIIPIGGLESTWDDWITLKGGARVATSHKSKGLTIHSTNVKGGDSLSELGKNENLFDELKS